MKEALRLAPRGLEGVSPNPLVGAVLVKNGAVVGRGWHRFFGGPHAEVEAIRAAGEKARGADLYVTLEPCGHHGKTPPCARAIHEAGVKRVFFAARDPNPLTRGRGPGFLRRHEIEVRGGLLAREAEEQNAPYFHWHRTGRPWVILKWAMTADGKIATRTGESRWISGARSRSLAQGLRRRVDAILVGTGTLLRDDPVLLPRPPKGRAPLRLILDRRGTAPLDLRIFAPVTGVQAGPRLYVTAQRAGTRRLEELARRGIDTLILPEWRGRLDLAALLDHLGGRGVSQLLVEGGEELHGAFLDARLAQEVVAFIAPRLLGGAEAPGPIGGRGLGRLAEALPLTAPRWRRLGGDQCLEARLIYL